MTRCLECSQAAGQTIDHTPYLDLPPLLARFEHFLATKGLLARPMGAADGALPTRGGAVPSLPMSEKHRQTAMVSLLHPLVEMGYLAKGEGSGSWTTIPGKDLRDVSARQILDYMVKRFPLDPCRAHRDGCERCCLPHHLSMYNKTCEAFRKMAEWLYFSEVLYGKPVWSRDKLVEVYRVTRRRKYTLRPPRINDTETSHRFQEWLEAKDRAYGYMVWFLQEFGARYEEMAHAEYPLEGPFARLNRHAGILEIVGKGREGGKAREVTLTPERLAKLEEILAWRRALGAKIVKLVGREAEPVLFPVAPPAPHDDVGHARDEDPSVFNRQLKVWGRRYNAAREAEGHPELAVDVDLLSSHKIGRPVYLTHRAASGVPEKMLMEEAGIADHSTLERYLRFDKRQRIEIMARADRRAGGGDNGSADPVAALEALIAGLDADVRALVEPMLRGAQETIRRVLVPKVIA